eukprot:TRINITY_DN27422_c0_g1_i1.p1 TRINITY_DN27422_c0_g1~~TRINITY_DN27422_c0_g1_i1.p1  ORF type:complete len:256 (+),score=38.98 TRINITY_DN27422_c0_g1_i1:92-859(+)
MADAGASKGERLLSVATAPNISAELPLALRAQEYIKFDTLRYDLRAAAAALLERASDVGCFPASSERLEEYEAAPAIFRSFEARRRLHQLVSEDSAFLAAYEGLVLEVLVPWLKSRLVEEVGISSSTAFSYQYPPTLRIQPGRSKEFKRPHRDAEYGHQVGEINFWMPLTNYSEMTQATLWVESRPDAGDYEPLAIDYGSIAAFHGTLCRHKVPANSSAFTRISMDFRIGVGEFFDKDWHLEGVKHVHGRREVVL